MYYSNILKNDMCNGPGVRVTLFVSGCPHHCNGCFNQETWDYHFGREYTAQTEQEILSFLSPSYISGLTLLGGEPMEHTEVLRGLVQKVRSLYPDKDIWCYTGYTWEEIWEKEKEFLSALDVLVDGPFVLEKKNLTLPFRGSSNQRLIDVPKSLSAHKIVSC